MAYDPGLAQTLRDALADHPINEQKMFGGLAFLLNGHMVCGVHKGGAMVRPFRRGFYSRVGLNVGEAVAASAVTPEALRERVAGLMG